MKEDKDEGDIEKSKPYITWHQRFAPPLKMGIIEDYSNHRNIDKLIHYKSSKAILRAMMNTYRSSRILRV